MDTLGAQPQDCNPHHVTQEQRLAAPQQGNIVQDDMARLSRIPVMGNDRVPTMTLQELWDWRAGWHAKRRPHTKSERLDYDECNRQIDDLASETDIDWEEFEKNEREMDTCPSPTQRNHPAWNEGYQLRRDVHKDEVRREARREARKQRKRFLSPPRTPPHLRGPGLYNQQQASLVPNVESFRVKKGKRDNRKAARRPITRSSGTPNISLHQRKGHVKFWHTQTKYVVISYEKYLRDYVSLVPLCYVQVSNLGSRIEKSLTSVLGSQWTSPTNIPNIHTRLNTSARYAGGAWRKIRKLRMQFLYLYLVGRDTSEVIKASSQELLGILKKPCRLHLMDAAT